MIIIKNLFLLLLDVSYIMTQLIQINRIGGVMVSVLASSTVDRGFEPRSGQTKDYEHWYLLPLS